MDLVTATLGFFLDTKLGRMLLFGAAMTTAVATTYFYIDAKAYNRGFLEAQKKCQDDQLSAGTKLLNTRAAQAGAGADIATKAANETAAAVTKINTQTNTDKEKNHEEYRAQPAAVACASRDVPAGVQARIDAAVERAND